MKKLRKIALSFVLALVLCLPVFFAVGCGENKETDKELTFSVVANDVVKSFGDYLGKLASENNNIAKKIDDLSDEETPDYDKIDELEQKMYDLQDAIDYLQNQVRYYIYPLLEMEGLEFDTLYSLYDTYYDEEYYAYAKKTKSGLEIYYPDWNEVYKYTYNGNKLSRIDVIYAEYTNFYQNTYYHTDVKPWSERGLTYVDLSSFDFENKVAYTFEIEGWVDEDESVYYNAVDAFVDGFNSGKLTTNDLNNIFGNGIDYCNMTFVNGTEVNNGLSIKSIKALKKEIGKINVPDLKVNIFDDVEEVEIDGEEIEYKVQEICSEVAYEDLDGYYFRRSDFELNYEKFCSLMEDVVAVATEYKDWVDSFGEMEGELPEYENCDIYYEEVNYENVPVFFANAASSLNADYIKETWQNFSKAIDFYYNPEAEAGIIYISGVSYYQGVNLQFVDGEIECAYTFEPNGDEGYWLTIYTVGQEITGINFRYFEWLH